LQAGGPLEQVIIFMTTSAEFANLAGSDSGFVEALFLRLLYRVGTSAEVSDLLARLPVIGRAGVAADILNSLEFRYRAVLTLYYSPAVLDISGFFPWPQSVSVISLLPGLLDRTTPVNVLEIDFWVSTGLDIDVIMVDLASSMEYFGNG
jgi:hypothetical protein